MELPQEAFDAAVAGSNHAHQDAQHCQNYRLEFEFQYGGGWGHVTFDII